MALPKTHQPILDQHELQSAVWKKLKAHFEEQLSERRAYNDGRSLGEVETAFIRGDIDRLKKIIGIG